MAKGKPVRADADVAVEENKANTATLAEFWLKEIHRYEESREIKHWQKESKDIVKKYKNHGSDVESTRFSYDRVMFNILWSNVQTMRPALYARTPNPIVERRIKSANPVIRLASTLGERTARYLVSVDKTNFDDVMTSVVMDRLLPGRGTSWIRFEKDNIPYIDPTTGQQAIDPETGEPVETITNERICLEHVLSEDFGHTKARNWPEVRAVFRRLLLSKAAATKRFGKKKADLLKFTYTPKDLTKSKDISDETKDSFRRAEVYEIHDLETKKVMWLTPEITDDLLDIREDPLGLRCFFPCPKPLYATLSTDSLIPTPDYILYRGLAEDLDDVRKRISNVKELIRVVSFHDKRVSEKLQSLVDLEDGESIPLENWPDYQGSKTFIEWIPFEEASRALRELQAQEEAILQRIYEVTGMPDIIRGNSSPSETAEAQQIKGQFATLRLTYAQKDVQRYARDVIAMMTEIAVEKFSDETLMAITGFEDLDENDKQLWPQALQLLRDDKWRTFAIDIETDSTIAFDEEMEKNARNEYITAMGQFFSQAFQFSQMEPRLKPVMLQMMQFGAKGYRAGRELEASVEQVVQDIIKGDEEAANQPPPVDPQIEIEQQKLQIEQMKAQSAQMAAQMKAQTDQMAMEAKAQMQQTKMQYDIELKQQKLDMSTQLSQAKLSAQVEQERVKMLLEDQRLQREAMMKLQAQIMQTQAQAKDKEDKAEKSKGAGAPVVHVHTGGKKKTVMSQPVDPNNPLGARMMTLMDDDGDE